MFYIKLIDTEEISGFILPPPLVLGLKA